MFTLALIHRPVACSLCLAVFAATLPGQAPERPVTESLPVRPTLKIAVLDGAGAVNSIRTRTAVQPVVEVRDQNDRPISGARVTFRLPAVGPGATFDGGQLTQQTTTNRLGQAAAVGMVPNQQPGRFHVQVEATYETLSASASVAQQNVLNPATTESAKSSRWWKYALALGAAGGAAGIFAARGKSGTTTAAAVPGPTLSITPGTPSVAGPR